MSISSRLECKRFPRMATTLLGLGIALLTAAASAATFTWDCPTNGNWSAATNWTGDVTPDNDGTADLVLTNVNTGAGGQGNYCYVDQPWSIQSVRFANQELYGSLNVALSDRGSLSVGAGGIVGGTGRPWFYQRAPIQFTTADSSIRNSMFWYGALDSTCSGGTRVHLQLTEFNGDTGMSTTTNVFFFLESGAPCLYATGLNVLGSNKVYVTLANPTVDPAKVRGIGTYGSSTSNHLYFDTPIEFDAATVLSGKSRYFSLKFQRTGTVSLVTHVRGDWTLANGPKITNTSGLGWCYLEGGGTAANNVNTKTYYEQNSSGILSDAVTDNAFSGDFFIYQGFHVINASHAFKAGNSAFFNIGGASGGASAGSNYVLLATSGNTVNGNIRLTGGDTVTNSVSTNRPWGTVGIEGAGSVEFKGWILLDRQTAVHTLKVMNLNLFAGPGGTATFSGGIAESSLNGKQVAGLVNVTGGGTVVLSGANSYTNTTTILGNTTLRLDGSLASALLEVGPGATLSGSGQTMGRLASSGTVAPGSGGLKVSGDAEFLPGSVLRMELPAGGDAAGLLEVGGALDLSYATLALSGGRANATYTIATAGRLTGDTVARIDPSRLTPGLIADSAQVQADGNRLRVTIVKGTTPPSSAGFAPASTPGTARWANGLSAGDPIAAEAGGLKVRSPQGLETLIPWPALSPGTRYRHEPGFPDRLRPPGAPADAEPLWPTTPRT